MRLFSYFFFTFPAVAGIRRIFMYRRLEAQSGIESIRDLPWVRFEQLLAEAYRRQGSSVIENFSGGADGGVDLVLTRPGERCLVQCKNWRTQSVGVKVVREMAGLLLNASSDTRVIIVTSSSFTPDARDFALGKPIELIYGTKLWEMVRGVQSTPGTSPAPLSNSVPTCPQCGSALVQRTARRGENAGSGFWGCSRYPKCRFTQDVVNGL